MSQKLPSSSSQVWTDRLERFEHAGTTVANFCLAEGVSQASYYYWRRKLRDAQAATPAKLAATFLPVALGPLDRPQPSPRHTTVMAVDLPGGIHVRLEVTACDQEAAS
jgi:hypothetical protein